MNGDNVSGAVNQQERPLHVAGWIVGFVDGEGCFAISIVRNATCRLGWQVQPEFSVTQGERSRDSLEIVKTYFGCGTIIRNLRHDNHRETMYRFSVRRRGDLVETILPFFETYPLRTAKAEEFERFRNVIELMGRGTHLTLDGLGRDQSDRRDDESAAASTCSGNPQRPYADQLTSTSQLEDMVHAPWRHGDEHERNSLSGKFRPARMA